MSKYIGLLTAAGLACLPVMSATAAPTLGEVLGASGVTLDGYISGSYVYGFNDGQALGARTFDGLTDSFTLNQAAFNLSKLPAQGAGAFVNVIAGDDASLLNGAYGDGDDKINVTQAYLQYATGGFTVIGGRFVTLAGAEVINDTANANISRGFLFTLLQPLVHTGVRTSLKLGSATVYAGLSNSAFSFGALGPDTDQQKTIELGVAVAPSSNSNLAVVAYHSSDNSLAGDVTLVDVVASLQATSALQLVLNADYLNIDPDGAGDDINPWGIAGYANMKFSPTMRGSLRLEHADNDLPSPADNEVQSITGTLGYMVASNLEVLGEVRWDNSDLDVFPDTGATGGVEDSQGDVAVKAIYKF